MKNNLGNLVENKKSKLIDKICLGAGAISFAIGLGFGVNRFVDKPENYSKIDEVESKIWSIEKSKEYLQEADIYSCVEKFDKELINLYKEKSLLETASEYQSWEKRCDRNTRRYAVGTLLGLGGIMISLFRYTNRLGKKEKDKLKD